MSYRLFLDDERMPKQVTWVNLPLGPWVIVRDYDEFVKCIMTNGLPEFVTFDHDLAIEHYIPEVKEEEYTEKTGMDCAKWLVDYCLDNGSKLPNFEVHSKNPAGAANIRSLLQNFKQFQS
jgi:hypothetical protein